MKRQTFSPRQGALRTTLKTVAFLIATVAFTPVSGQTQDTESLLQEFVDSYRHDPMALSVTFGIKVEDDWWHVTCTRVQEGYPVGKSGQYTFHNFGPHDVQLHRGPLPAPGWYFEFDSKETLEKISARSLTAATATAKSRGSDVVPLNIREMEGYQGSISDDALSYMVMEHFWKKGPVEITRFSRDASMPTHGVAHVGLYTMKDKRIGWFSLGPEEAANADRDLDRGQVPNLFIITSGRGQAILGDQQVELEPGMSIFVGPYQKHVFYNPYDKPMEGIVVLFGDNIDYARGKSYIDHLEEQLDFYRSYNQGLKELTR
ncbi:MAG: cupin domain-containing protein [Saprospiraceae bacterium]|nr:cupin domain-containing protein [Saprospiraceae bacterium]